MKAVLPFGGQFFPARPWFYTGTHRPNWLWDGSMSFPLMVSQRTLGDTSYDSIAPAVVPWALDSGGFTELSLYGKWTLPPEVYVGCVADYDRHIGLMQWAAPMDWMCEPVMISGGIIGRRRVPGTHLSVAEHQRRTVDNYLTLCELWPQHRPRARCPFIPVLQGWEPDDYWACVDLYERAGVDLDNAPLVGLGSVCRRQATAQIGYLIEQLAARFRLHGFGVKTLGIARYGHLLTSADSLAWSIDARLTDPLPGHETAHKSCSNCRDYAAIWTADLADKIDDADRRGRQESLFTALGEAV